MLCILEEGDHPFRSYSILVASIRIAVAQQCPGLPQPQHLFRFSAIQNFLPSPLLIIEQCSSNLPVRILFHIFAFQTRNSFLNACLTDSYPNSFASASHTVLCRANQGSCSVSVSPSINIEEQLVMSTSLNLKSGILIEDLFATISHFQPLNQKNEVLFSDSPRSKVTNAFS